METERKTEKLTRKAVMLNSILEDGTTLGIMEKKISDYRDNATAAAVVGIPESTDETGLRDDMPIPAVGNSISGYIEIPRIV